MAEAELGKVPGRNDCIDCYTSTPTCSSSGVSSDSATVVAVDSIIGRFSNIEQKYHIDSVDIGTGYQSDAVRECIDRATGQKYAVKSIRKTRAKMTDLRREVELLKEIKHDDIVRLFDVYEDSEYLHIVTDLYTGGELYDKIVWKKESSNAGCFSEDEAARILRQLLNAISYLHGRGIVHRDIKLENIMFETAEENSSVKLIDFGLARRHCKDSSEPYMRTVVGSAYFMAPEVLGEKYDKACDVWSLGVVAFIMLCGHPPFNGADNEDLCRAIRRGKLKFKTRHWKGASKEAKDFVRRLLQVKPGRRMAIEDALNHPWLVNHGLGTRKEEENQVNSFVRAMPKRLKRKDSVLSFRRDGQQKLKLSIQCLLTH